MRAHADGVGNALFALCDLLTLVYIKQGHLFQNIAYSLPDRLFQLCNRDLIVAYQTQITGGCRIFSFAA